MVVDGVVEVDRGGLEPGGGPQLARPVAPKRDLKQFRQACREVGLSARERYEASDALHAEKQLSGDRGHLDYEDLVAWLREWKATNG